VERAEKGSVEQAKQGTGKTYSAEGEGRRGFEPEGWWKKLPWNWAHPAADPMAAFSAHSLGWS
jgi:hypothetical protein